MMQFNSKSK